MLNRVNICKSSAKQTQSTFLCFIVDRWRASWSSTVLRTSTRPDDTLLYMVHDTFEDDVNHVVEGGDWYVEVSGILIINMNWVVFFAANQVYISLQLTLVDSGGGGRVVLLGTRSLPACRVYPVFLCLSGAGTHSLDIPTLIDIPTPWTYLASGHTNPLDIPIIWTYPPPGHIPTPRHTHLGRNLVPEIPTPCKGHGTRDTHLPVNRMTENPVKKLPSRNYWSSPCRELHPCLGNHGSATESLYNCC